MLILGGILKMNIYDEYQKSIRYKYESRAFTLVIALTILNLFTGFVFNIQWTWAKEFEAVFIIFIALTYTVVMNVYNGAHFTKWQNPIRNSISFLVLGLSLIIYSLVSRTPLLVDRQLSLSSFILLVGVSFLSIPCSYAAKVNAEKERDREIEWVNITENRRKTND